MCVCDVCAMCVMCNACVGAAAEATTTAPASEDNHTVEGVKALWCICIHDFTMHIVIIILIYIYPNRTNSILFIPVL